MQIYKDMGNLKITALSDLHGTLPQNIEPCDVVLITGDLIPLHYQNDMSLSKMWFQVVFRQWCDDLPCNKVIFIGGNHDMYLEMLYLSDYTSEEINRILFGEQDKIEYIQDQLIEYQGVTIYGTPWCPVLYRWAFYKDHEDLLKVFKKIPNCDILLTHCPPQLDRLGIVMQSDSFNYMNDYGCVELTECLEGKKIQCVLCGHIHSGDHRTIIKGDTRFVNCSILDEDYEVKYMPYEFEITHKY